ncbi:MAG: UDP-2,3-diacylglucosamine diphosphatase [Rikenellaceae bacterium]|nr:UDP-2,3-diacylglucosamine diphosphatase [Rikenellaceae bacterium]
MAYYFVSDVHAGLVLDGIPTRAAERFTAWLDAVSADARAVFLLGDIFDFWFEYPQAVPSGYEPVLERFKQLTAKGIQLHFFPGNHDMWTLDYLSRECGVIIHPRALSLKLCGRQVYMEHGDLRSIGSFGERVMQGIFRSRAAQKIGRTLVPYSRMMAFGTNWSRSNRAKHTRIYPFRKEEKGIVRFARRYLKKNEVDLFVFGHLHTPMAYRISDRTALYILGDWILERPAVYGRLDRSGFSLCHW